MATALTLSGAARAAALDAEYDVLNSGFLDIYDNGAAKPAGPDTAVPGGSVKLVRLTLNATAFAAAVAGTNTATKTANAITSGTAIATGTALWARILKSNGTAIADCDVATAGGAVTIATTSIVTGAVVSASSFVITR